MTAPLLKSRYTIPPLRDDLIPRPQLIEQLDEALKYKMTLVSAPAGFGKTTLLGMWLAQRRLPAAWLSLEDSDNEPLQFLEYLLAALQIVDIQLGNRTKARLAGSQPPGFDQLLIILQNEILDYQGPLVIILDDYHVIQSPVIQRSLANLVERLPAHIHLVLATRSDPVLAVGRLRAQGQLLELRTAELRFSPQEASHFFTHSMQLNLSPQQVELLSRRTEGWISGLQLAGLSLQGRPPGEATGFITSFSGSNRFVLDYLLDEVLLQQDHQLQLFLLQTSILKRLSAPLCQAVSGMTSSQEVLETLEARNLFTFPLDDERIWYRYHHLFADLLQKRLLRHSGPEAVRSLHLEASRWHQDHGSLTEAIDHAIQAGQPERAADLLELSTLEAFSRGEFVPFDYWLDQLPLAIVQRRPLLCVNAAWLEIWSGGHSIDLGDEWMLRAETALDASEANGQQPYFDGHTMHQIVASYQAAYRAITVGLRGPPDPSWIDIAHNALQVISDDDWFLRGIVFAQLGIVHLTIGDLPAAQEAFRQAERLGRSGGNTYGSLLAVYIQTEIFRQHGKLQQAESKLRESIETLTDAQAGYSQPPPIVGAIYTALGDILRESGRTSEACHWLDAGLQLVKPASLGVIGIDNNQTVEEEGYVLGSVALARLEAVAGDNRPLAELDELAERCSPGLQKYIRLHQVRLWLTSPDRDKYWEKATTWAQGQPLKVANPTWDWDHEIPSLLSLVRVHIAQANRHSLSGSHPEWVALIGFLDEQAQVCRRRGLVERLIEILVLSALVHKASGKTDLAMDALVQALDQAGREGYQRIFLDEAQPMLGLLYQGLETGRSTDSIETLLAAGAKPLSTSTPAKPATRPKKLPLTRREIEILELIASGSTNAEICQVLSISLGTVKRHTANINLKLDTHNRTQAVARARSMGLLAE